MSPLVHAVSRLVALADAETEACGWRVEFVADAMKRPTFSALYRALRSLPRSVQRETWHAVTVCLLDEVEALAHVLPGRSPLSVHPDADIALALALDARTLSQALRVWIQDQTEAA